MAGDLRDLGRRHRALITVLGSLATAAALVLVLAGRRDEFTAAISEAAALVLALTVLLQIVVLLARSEAWHLSIAAAAGPSRAASSIAHRACRCSAASSTGKGSRRGSPTGSGPAARRRCAVHARAPEGHVEAHAPRTARRPAGAGLLCCSGWLEAVTP
jgi:hypothetical protein